MNAAPVLHADPAAESVLQPALRECVARAVRRYLSDLDGDMPDDLYELVLNEVEGPLLREVLQWAAVGKSDWEIGEILAISEKTVNAHIENVKRKYGVTSRIHAVVKGMNARAIHL